MARDLPPRETLSKEDLRTLGAVRRDIWTNAFIGGGFGMGSGLILHTGAQWARRFGLHNAKLNRNTIMLSMLGGGAVGMFLLAASTGKQEVHNLHHIFQNGAVPKGELNRFDYQKTMQNAKQRGEATQDGEPHHGGDNDNLDLQKLEQIRIVRRQSLMDTLEKGHGLSDSHGGKWYRDKDEIDPKRLEEIRVVRRRSLMDNLEKGRGLSDSHGGHWVSRDDK